jgi:hypothetical protein
MPSSAISDERRSCPVSASSSRKLVASMRAKVGSGEAQISKSGS